MADLTRRAFITTGVVAGTGLVVGVALRPGHRTPGLAPLVAEADETLVHTWVKIAADNRITAIVPHCEMGQGAQTALTQMLADELDAAWADVDIVEAPAEDDYANWALAKGYLLGNVRIPRPLVATVDGAFLTATRLLHVQSTGGSASIRATGVHGMRVAGAATRALLIRAAAERWAVPPTELVAEDTHIVHRASDRRAPFAAFAPRAGELTPSSTPELKRPDAFRIMGRAIARHDIPPKVDGTARYGIDVDVPGMKYAAIRSAPVFGAKVARIDETSALSMPGVHRVLDLGDAVAVVADGCWQAEQALGRVDVQWTETGDESLDSDALLRRFDAALDDARRTGGNGTDIERGDVHAALEQAHRVVEATYRVPWLAHATMEPMNATARFEADRCEVWVGAQDPLGFRHAVADALDLDASKVTLHQHWMGGGFGRRAYPDVAVRAARIARAAGVPVKLIWSREEDIRQDHYRPAVTSRFRAALAASGELVAWENVYHEKQEPAEAPLPPYAIEHQHVFHVDVPTHVPTGIWRSVDHSQHGFFTESFVDELAHAADRDPYAFRRDMLAHEPRQRAVLDLAARQAGWGEPLAPNRGRGIALQASFGSIVAQVVEVTVEDGELSVDRVVCAVDCGFAVSPDGVAAQMESGILYGLTAALHGEIEIERGAVKQSNFHDYRSVRMGEAPVIETHIIDSGEAWGGAGEPGTPAIAPALANAVFQATGLRIRELPLSKHVLRAPVERDDMDLTG